MILDFKKLNPELYLPKTTPSIVDVPAMTFLAVDGSGDPNTSAEYAAAIELLYGLSYAIKMGNKAVLEYVVAPPEGFWQVADSGFGGGGDSVPDKGKFLWTMLIRQPDFVDGDVLELAKASLARRKPGLDASGARLASFAEGLCVQALHVGAYDDEAKTAATIDAHAVETGHAVDIGETRRHHEIYLSDPRKVPAGKLKTVIRHPIRRI